MLASVVGTELPVYSSKVSSLQSLFPVADQISHQEKSFPKGSSKLKSALGIQERIEGTQRVQAVDSWHNFKRFV